MKRFAILSVTIGLVVSASFAQQPVPDLSVDGPARSGYWAKWDFRSGSLIFYRDVDKPSSPAVRLVRADGSSTPFYPLRDLPGARAVVVWDVAQTPEGGVVLSAIAEYAERGTEPMPLKSLLMTYDREARLSKFWDVFPYHHHHIAVDGSGNVFALGVKESKRNDYPLLIKYSPDGKVSGEFLPANLFPVGDDVVESGSPNGESEMFINGRELVIWLAPVQELVRLSLEGRLLSRSSWEGPLQLLAMQSGSKRAKIEHASGLPNGDVVAQVSLWPAKGSKAPLQSAIAIFPRDGSEAYYLKPPRESHEYGRFLGGDPDGGLIFMERGAGPWQAVLMHRH